MLNSFYISPRIKRIGNGEVCSDYDVQKRISGASKQYLLETMEQERQLC